MAQTPVPQNSSAGCLVRLFWMCIGNVILFFCLTYIFHNRVRGLALVDLSYWLTVVVLVAARWVDIRSYHGATVTGEPATLSHWRRYALCLVVGSLIVWIIIHLMAWTGSLSSVSAPAGAIP